jgi:hypothetical protein
MHNNEYNFQENTIGERVLAAASYAVVESSQPSVGVERVVVLVTTAATAVISATTLITTTSMMLSCSFLVLVEGHNIAADWATEAPPVVHF